MERQEYRKCEKLMSKTLEFVSSLRLWRTLLVFRQRKMLYHLTFYTLFIFIHNVLDYIRLSNDEGDGGISHSSNTFLVHVMA